MRSDFAYEILQANNTFFILQCFVAKAIHFCVSNLQATPPNFDFLSIIFLLLHDGHHNF